MRRSGIIRQGVVVNLDEVIPLVKTSTDSDKTNVELVFQITNLLIDFEGVNGMLPNQDIVNGYIKEWEQANEIASSRRYRRVGRLNKDRLRDPFLMQPGETDINRRL